MTDFLAQATSLFEYTQSLRRDFHIHPELGFREVRTGGIVAKELEALGLEVTKGVGKTGVVGLLEGETRPDFPAPLRHGCPAHHRRYRRGICFTEPGRHACLRTRRSHRHWADGRKNAPAHRDELAGNIKFCFQPSEEGTNGEEVGGDEMMMRDGVLDAPKVDMSFHFISGMKSPLGWLGIASGPVMAGAEIFYNPASLGEAATAPIPHADH